MEETQVDLERYIERVRLLAEEATKIAEELRRGEDYVIVNVHQYALEPYIAYLRRFYSEPGELYGVIPMNPGKNGAVRTGIPFTDPYLARQIFPEFAEWEKHISLPVVLPPAQREFSGRRVYAWGRKRFGSVENFVRKVLIYLPCPIAVLKIQREKVVNVPIDLLPYRKLERILTLIGEHLPEMISVSKPKGIMLWGRFAERIYGELRRKGKWEEKIPVARAKHPAARLSDTVWFQSASTAFRYLASKREHNGERKNGEKLKMRRQLKGEFHVRGEKK
ncbi:MAG: hypothetical protein V2G48_03940 [bacterium JZ-2024 1]